MKQSRTDSRRCGSAVCQRLRPRQLTRDLESNTTVSLPRHLQFRQLGKWADDTELVGSEVDSDRLVLRRDDAAQAVRVMCDAILSGKPLDRLDGLEVVEGTSRKESPPGGGSWLHLCSMPS